MATKRIKRILTDISESPLKFVYDDGTFGELDISKAKLMPIARAPLIGLTLKQAKLYLGIKEKR